MQTLRAVAQRLPRLEVGSEFRIALLFTLLLAALHASTGFRTIADPGADNDSLLRLVQIRDLLGGQSWFDLHMYRMGPEGGFALHWSRLVDLPIALMILAGQALGLSQGAAEDVARTLWPLGLFGTAIYFIVLAARRAGGEAAVLPAAVLGAAALYFSGQFAPGSIDHHNVQLVLVLAMTAALLDPRRLASSGAAAGACAALTLAIGMEAAPYAATAGMVASLAFLLRGPREAGFAAGFGAAFAIATAAAFAGLVHPSAWLRASCDALSSFQLTVAVAGGGGLALLALTPRLNVTPLRRVLGLLALGAVVLAMVVATFPQCLASPYADLDPRLRLHWLDHVSEAKSLAAIAAAEPDLVFAYYATPVLGLLALGLAMVRSGARLADATLAALLVTALAVSAWQVRGATFSLPLAAIVLAICLAPLRLRLARHQSPLAAVGLAAAWIACFNVTWGIAGGLVFPAPTTEGAGAAARCHDRTAYAPLAGLAPGAVLAPSDLGAPIVLYSGHRALSGPYHRNGIGKLATLDAFLGDEEAARSVVRDQAIDYVVLCPGLPEIGLLTRQAPDGFLAELAAGTAPSWLTRVDAGDILDVYRVTNP